jgi:hypothetical protein
VKEIGKRKKVEGKWPESSGRSLRATKIRENKKA